MYKILKELESSEKKIEKANDEKIQVIEKFMNDITEVCNLSYEIWKDVIKNIEERLKEIEKKYDYQLGYRSDYELSIPNIIIKLKEKLPIFNAGDDYIIDSLPMVNEEWKIEDLSDEKIMKINVEPVNLRYGRNEEEENLTAFYYIMPHDVHKKLLKEELEKKKMIVSEYIGEMVNEYLSEIESKVKVKAKIKKDIMCKLDLKDPVVVEEIKRIVQSYNKL